MFTFFFSKNNKFSAKPVLCCIITAFLLIATNVESLYAQAKLSVQGIVKKSNGVALEDGEYSITFNIYAKDGSPAGILWFETISDVEVIGGIYSVILGGNGKVLDLPFDQDYELGVKIGSSELLPRIDLTSAPYALSLRGSSNQFPSSGQVLADSMLINGGIKVNSGVLAKGGAPGVNGANKAGYAFSGNNGDNDSGLFSTADGKAALYSNNTEILSVTPGTATVSGILNTSNVDIINNGSVKYNGLGDWRLVETDYFDSDAEDWKVYGPAFGQWFGWNNPSQVGGAPRIDLGNFIGNILLPADNEHVLKKEFNTSNTWGSFTQIKVRFRYFFIDSWDFGGGDRAWAAFSTNVSGTGLRVGWQTMYQMLNTGNDKFNWNTAPTTFVAQASFLGRNDWCDNWMDVEMTGKAAGSNFWVFIGAGIDHGGVTDERFGVGAVEVYVR